MKIVFWMSGLNIGAGLVYFLQDETGMAIVCGVIAAVCFGIYLISEQVDDDYEDYE